LISSRTSGDPTKGQRKMCNPACITFILKYVLPTEVEGKRVLEVGAQNVNGSVRSYIEKMKPAEYVGVDITSGSGVDLVCNAEDLVEAFGEDLFDVVITTEMMEHVMNWRTVISNLKRVLKPNGVLFITTRSKGFGYHGYPYDFWRYSVADMQAIFADMTKWAIEPDPSEPGVFVKVQKPLDFAERNLTEYQLYSVVPERKCTMQGNAPASPITGVPGWVKQAEQERLVELAKAVPENGRILEVGGEFGCSASLFARGAAESVEIVTVDLFPDDLLTKHTANLAEAGFPGRTIQIKGDSKEIVKGWSGDSIDLLFLDGDHSYEGAKADVESWSVFVPSGGVMAVHDYAPTLEPGKWHYLHYEVRRAIDEWLEGQPDWSKVSLTDSLLVLKHTAKAKPKAKAKAKPVEEPALD
jgi:predicted O-methyltransferase YrrM